MRKSVIGALCALLLVGCGSPKASANHQSDEDILRVGMECAYAPNNWEEDTKSETNVEIENHAGFYAEGYDVQIARLVGEQLGRKVVVVKLAWDGLIQAVNTGTIDVIIAGMMDTSERKQAIDFSETYGIGTTEYTILTLKDSAYASATSIQDFKGASVLGQKDTYLDTVIDQIDGVNHISPVASIPNMVDRLLQKTVDGIVVDTDSAKAYSAVHPEIQVLDFADGEGFKLDYTGSCIGVAKGQENFVQALNKALSTIDDTTRQTLMDQASERMPK